MIRYAQITQHIYFDRTTGSVRMFGEEIPWVSETRYLELVLDERLTRKPYIEHVRPKTVGGIAALRPIMDMRSKLNIKNKVLLNKSLIRLIMTYVAPVWDYARSKYIDRLQIVQNIILREAVDALWFVRNVDIQKDTNSRLRKSPSNFIRRCPPYQPTPSETLATQKIRRDTCIRETC